jgi:hypothetical protein
MEVVLLNRPNMALGGNLFFLAEKPLGKKCLSCCLFVAIKAAESRQYIWDYLASHPYKPKVRLLRIRRIVSCLILDKSSLQPIFNCYTMRMVRKSSVVG